jgi:pyrophosphatase PpaX
MKQYEYILFDWDGCLAKTLDIHLDSYKKTFAEYGIYPEDRTITHEIFGSWDSPKKLGIKDIKTYTKKYLARADKACQAVVLYDGVKETLAILKKRGKKLVLITSSLRTTVKAALKYNGLENMFEIVLFSEDVSNIKPDPEVINLALEKLGGKKDQSIIVGDSKSDLGAANNAGIDSLLFYPEHNKKFYDLNMLKTYNPTYIINDFAEVLKIII